MEDDELEYVRQRLAVPGGDLTLLQPSDAAELPDDGPVEWAPLLPYSWVLWRSGMALASELGELPLAGLRVVELGCGLGVPSLVAARAGADVLATDEDPDALELIQRNARENGVSLGTARVEWSDAEALVARGPFDLVLAADVLYELRSAELLLELLPRLGHQVLLADPARPRAGDFFERAANDWAVEMWLRDRVEIYRLDRPQGGPGLRRQ